MKRFLNIVLALFVSGSLFAQDSGKEDIKNVMPKGTQFFDAQETNQYKTELDVGGRIATNGWSIYVELEKRKNELLRNIFQFEVGETKHPKEDKQSLSQGLATDPFGGLHSISGRPFVYGKKNVFYQVRLGYGQRRTIGTKGIRNGVEVSVIYMGGVTAGLLKPYYLRVLDQSGTGNQYIKYDEETADDFLNINNIMEGGGFSRGWKEVTLTPGVYGRVGMRFDWAQINRFVSAVDVGVTGTYYTKEAEIMVDTKGKNLFYGAYISLLFGKRW